MPLSQVHGNLTNNKIPVSFCLSNDLNGEEMRKNFTAVEAVMVVKLKEINIIQLSWNFVLKIMARTVLQNHTSTVTNTRNTADVKNDAHLVRRRLIKKQ